MNTYAIFGLGNPGDTYTWTRHNIGFEVVDHMTRSNNAELTSQKNKYQAFSFIYKGSKIFLVKPLTFMNLSGEAYQAFLSFYKIPIENTITVVDDIDLPFGKVRIKPSGSAGTHNGLKSIHTHIGSSYPRLRLGISGDTMLGPLDKYVLAKFNESETVTLKKLLVRFEEIVFYWMENGTEKTMNFFNGKDDLLQ